MEKKLEFTNEEMELFFDKITIFENRRKSEIADNSEILTMLNTLKDNLKNHHDLDREYLGLLLKVVGIDNKSLMRKLLTAIGEKKLDEMYVRVEQTNQPENRVR